MSEPSHSSLLYLPNNDKWWSTFFIFYFSVAFSSLGFVALYIAGKCHCFNSKGRGHAYRLCMVIIPLLWATLIAASRTADFHHHWQGM
jgi:hypothetical protein